MINKEFLYYYLFVVKGKKVAPLLIFKGKRNKTTEKNLNNLPIVKEKKIFVICQNNAWCDSEVFMHWLLNIYENYQ